MFWKFTKFSILKNFRTQNKKNSKNFAGYTFCFNETESPRRGKYFFVSTNLTYKLQPDLLIIEPGSLDSTLIELIISKQRKK